MERSGVLYHGRVSSRDLSGCGGWRYLHEKGCVTRNDEMDTSTIGNIKTMVMLLIPQASHQRHGHAREGKGSLGQGWIVPGIVGYLLDRAYAHLQAAVSTCPLAARAASLRLRRAFPFCCSQPVSGSSCCSRHCHAVCTMAAEASGLR